MKTNGLIGKIVALISAIGNWFSGNSTGWQRNNMSMMRETNKNSQRGCVHNPKYHQRGRKYAKCASGSIGIGIKAGFKKSVFCQQKKLALAY